MSLSTSPPRRRAEVLQDKPEVERTDHANLERRPAARAFLHPRAGAGATPVPYRWHAPAWARGS